MSHTSLFLSIIIPVYRTKDYLRKCVNSILEKQLKDYEIILVDDGSPDESGKLCDKLAAKHSVIRVIHQENGGASKARNSGITAAKGQYLIFMDSDDYWNPGVSLVKMLEKVKKQPAIEMWLFYWLDYFEGEGFFKRNEHCKLDRIDTSSGVNFYRSLLSNGSLEVSACSKIIRKEFLQKNNLYFQEKLLGEDNEWMMRVLRYLQKPGIIAEPLYIYVQRNSGSSISSSISLKNVQDILLIIEQTLTFYERNNLPVREMEYSFCAYLWFVALGLGGAFLSWKELRTLRQQFIKTFPVTKFQDSPKAKLASSVYRIFGATVTAWILGWYIRFNNKKKPNRIKVADKL